VTDPARDAGQQSGGDLAEADDEDQADAAQRRGRDGRRAAPRRHRPHGVERVLHGHRHAAGAEQGAGQADDQGQAGAVQRADAALDLRPDHRVRAERRAEQVLAQRRIVAHRDVQQRDQHEQRKIATKA